MLERTTTGNLVLAHIKPLGTTAAHLRRTLGLEPERLDAALKSLRDAKLIRLDFDGKFYRVGVPVPQIQPMPSSWREHMAPAWRACVANRTKRDKEILKLRKKGLSHLQIGMALGINADSARKRFYLARKRTAYAEKRLKEIDEYGI